MKWVAALLLTMSVSSVWADETLDSTTPWAVVQAGAFVIPSSGLPWTDPEGRAAGKRIGYMRVGTVVKVGPCLHVNGPDDASTGQYCDIRSETGVEGKTLKSSLHFLKRGEKIAVARTEIKLYAPDNAAKRRGSFSRNSHPVIRLNDSWQDKEPGGLIRVSFPDSQGQSDTTIKQAILKEDLVNCYVIETPDNELNAPVKYERQRSESGINILVGEKVSLWSIKQATSNTASALASKVITELGWQNDTEDESKELIEKVFDVSVSTLDKIFCVSDIKADVSAGFDLLGNGLKISGSLPVYQKGKLFDIDVDVVEKSDVAKYWMVTTKTVVCEVGAGVVDSRPKAVESVSVILIRKGPLSSAVVLNTDGAKRYGLQIPSAVDDANTPRLFELDSFVDYNRALRYLKRQIVNSGVGDQINHKEMVILQHAMINKFAYFLRYVPDDEFEEADIPDHPIASANHF